jgi:hypothetical protein
MLLISDMGRRGPLGDKGQFEVIDDAIHHGNLREQGDEGGDIRFFMAAIYAVQGNKDEAIRWLEKAVEATSPAWNTNYILRYPLFENIRDDARFKRITDEAKAKVAKMRRRVEQMEREGR